MLDQRVSEIFARYSRYILSQGRGEGDNPVQMTSKPDPLLDSIDKNPN